MDAHMSNPLSHQIARRHRIDRGRKFRLKDHDPADTGLVGAEDKPRAKEALDLAKVAVAQLQDMLYAQDRWSMLLIFQAMDAAGKDGVIKHVMSGVNPQGCQVYSFKAPSAEELDHDWMWRCARALPERGRIGIFNRSYYEEVLVVKVHPTILRSQKLPPALIGKRIWDERYQDIRAFERHLARNGTMVLKFFLNVSRAEQKRRFLERIEHPEKNWKFSAADVRERAHWNEYMDAYQAMIRETATPHAPWYVVPADNKWYTRIVVGSAIVDAMAGLGLRYPRVDKTQRAELLLAGKSLAAERR
jgi:PPK2 family polyphosphate:nucleotide phosphotransferase